MLPKGNRNSGGLNGEAQKDLIKILELPLTVGWKMDSSVAKNNKVILENSLKSTSFLLWRTAQMCNSISASSFGRIGMG